MIVMMMMMIIIIIIIIIYVLFVTVYLGYTCIPACCLLRFVSNIKL